MTDRQREFPNKELEMQDNSWDTQLEKVEPARHQHTDRRSWKRLIRSGEGVKRSGRQLRLKTAGEGADLNVRVIDFPSVRAAKDAHYALARALREAAQQGHITTNDTYNLAVSAWAEAALEALQQHFNDAVRQQIISQNQRNQPQQKESTPDASTE